MDWLGLWCQRPSQCILELVGHTMVCTPSIAHLHGQKKTRAWQARNRHARNLGGRFLRAPPTRANLRPYRPGWPRSCHTFHYKLCPYRPDLLHDSLFPLQICPQCPDLQNPGRCNFHCQIWPYCPDLRQACSSVHHKVCPNRPALEKSCSSSTTLSVRWIHRAALASPNVSPTFTPP